MNTLCPECGFKVSIDEDGCCAACGANATGAGVDAVYERIRELEAESAGRLRELNRKAEEARQEWMRAEAAEGQNAALKAKLRAIAELPRKWATMSYPYRACADELDAILKEKGDD